MAAAKSAASSDRAAEFVRSGETVSIVALRVRSVAGRVWLSAKDSPSVWRATRSDLEVTEKGWRGDEL
jgi:hypothetical protein